MFLGFDKGRELSEFRGKYPTTSIGRAFIWGFLVTDLYGLYRWLSGKDELTTDNGGKLGFEAGLTPDGLFFGYRQRF